MKPPPIYGVETLVADLLGLCVIVGLMGLGLHAAGLVDGWVLGLACSR